MANFEKQVLAVEKTGDKPGSWIKLTVADDKEAGKTRNMYLKEAGLQALVTKPGFYSFTMEKNGKFFEPTGATFLRPLNGNTPPPNEKHLPPSSDTPNAPVARRDPALPDPNVLVQNRSITSQVAIKAAADVVVAALNNGGFKGTQAGLIDVAGAAEAATSLASMFMDAARRWTNPEPKAEPGTYAGVYKDAEGRLHEPVAPEGA